LLLGLFSLNIDAQEQSGSIDSSAINTLPAKAPAAPKVWRLGISPFYFVSPEELAVATESKFDFPLACDLARNASENALSFSLPTMLLSDLDPLPKRSLSVFAGTEGTATFIPVVLNPIISEGILVDIGKDLDVFSANDGIATGFYSREGDSIRCVILFFEKGLSKPIGSTSFTETIDTLEDMKDKTLPQILSWTANRPVGIIDVKVAPTGGSATITLQPSDFAGGSETSGTRAFVYEPGDYTIVVSRKGYETGQLRIPAFAVGTYRAAEIELIPAMGISSTQSSFSAAADSLKLLDVNAFRDKEKKFHSALGRFILGVPITAIALGTFFSYWEAYSRSAASAGALYFSGGAAALCVSFEIGFIIDTAIKLVDVLRASK
ncbi:MAG: hypothetical protein WC820_10315, partial [Spirochaetales bacterium]